VESSGEGKYLSSLTKEFLVQEKVYGAGKGDGGEKSPEGAEEVSLNFHSGEVGISGQWTDHQDEEGKPYQKGGKRYHESRPYNKTKEEWVNRRERRAQPFVN